MEVFAIGTDHRIYHSWQSGFTMSPTEALGSATFSQPPAAGRNADGRLELFAVGADQHLWHAYQVAPNGSWSDWYQLDANNYVAPPSVTSNADGRLEVFAIATGNTLWHGWQSAPNGGWSAFLPLAGGVVA